MTKGPEEANAGTAAPGSPGPAHRRAASEEDLRVVVALRQGDENTFARLVEQHHATLRHIARLYLSDAAVAEEVAQDTWLGVIQGVWAFEGRSSLKTWILRILINRAKTRALREGRTIPFAKLGIDDLEEAEAVLSGAHSRPSGDLRYFLPPAQANEAGYRVSPLRDPGPSPETKLLADEAREHLRKAIEALPANLRIVLTMRDVEGRSSEEVCNILGIRETNQRVLLHRARSRVRTALQPYFEGE
jgi:RNA polymerase sigma-70 factor (ECF subfamily)